MTALRLPCVLAALVMTASAAAAQTPAPESDGAPVFARECATCHGQETGRAAPAVEALRQLTPDAILTALTTGRMRVEGERLTDAERRAVAEFLTGRAPSDSAATVAGRCATTPPLPAELAGPRWNGWGVDARNARYQPPAHANLAAADVPRLQLKWAFGFAGALAARTQPTVVAGRLFTASETGDVYAIDAKTGCTYWTYRARAAVRTAMSVAATPAGSGVRFAVYFGDGQAHAYALDAETGGELWVRKLDDHPNASITAAPTVHANRVYVTVAAAGEEVRGARLDYACCTFRGSVSAIDMATGSVVWKTYSIPMEPAPRAKNKNGVQLYGPAGAAIWGAPTIDEKRGLLYVGTGNGFADPPQPTMDAVLALELVSGRVRWVRQTVPNDVWIWQCPPENPDNPNCPATQGPDFDISASPVLAATPSGRDLLIVAQKSGMVYALDPDNAGEPVWEYRIGEGSAFGGQWGAAVDATRVYIGSAAAQSSRPGGMHAIDLETGRRVWFTPPSPPLCEGGAAERCTAAQGAAVTAIDGIVFSGAYDGGLRAYSTADGTIVWQVNTNREFETVNGVKAAGATLDGAGPVIVDGMLYVNSGYNGIVGRAGNVLLAFEVR